MHRLVLACLVALALCGASCAQQGKVYPDRFVYVSRGLHSDSDVRDIENIVKTAAAHGLNGMVLAAGLDRLDLQPPDYFKRLEQVKAICQRYNVELIPMIFSVGYGGSILAHDRNLAAGLPVKDALFVVRKGEARLVPDPPVEIKNGGFERFAGDRMADFNFHDKPGEVSFADTRVFHSGRASLRMESFQPPHGHGRVMQMVAVHPYRLYRVTVWVKTEGLEPEGAFRVQVYGPHGQIAPWDPRQPATANWRKVQLLFNSRQYDKVRIYVGVWGAKRGRLWLDDLSIEEVGLVNVLRRPGTPIVVRSEDGSVVYEEGRDYEPIRYSSPGRPRFTDMGAQALPIKLTKNSRIREGQRLRVSFYHGIAINRGQVTICMSEPKVYQIWEKQVQLIHKLLAPNKYFFSMDEIRAGGSCAACKARKMTMAQILGDCITRQAAIVRKVNPKAEIYIWSDMLDPNHNAHDNYYLVEGDFTGSWNYVPKDLIIVCWYYDKREQSLRFFSEQGFRTLAGAYYDGDTLDNPKGWLAALDRTPRARGIMYTTWRNKYELLAPFGDLVSRR